MNKKLILTLAILVTIPITIPSFSALADDKYITDNISVYVRRGPGTRYGLTGSLKAGDKVTILDTSEDGTFTKIKDDKNRIAWIESELLTSTPSAKIRLPQFEQQIEILKEQIANSDQEKQSVIDDYSKQLTIAQNRVNELEKVKISLETQLAENIATLENLNKEIDESSQNIMLTWFTRGGLVAGSGLFLGLILPYLIPKRRKRDRWMN